AVLLGVTVVTVTPLSPREYPLDILASDRRSLYPPIPKPFNDFSATGGKPPSLKSVREFRKERI
ncbi:MAG: hypothetical protein K6F27_08015, partial [Ruminococcus sp.]|nr:hypothetical protein [Ruminococcus sp.]